MANIQKLGQENQELKTFVVFGGGPELKDPIQKLAAEKSVSIPLTFLPQGTEAGDFKAWRISPQAKNTVILYTRRRAHANFVDVTDKTFEAVKKEALAMLGK